jgi:undecaprenyl-diphosphatase
MWKQRVTIGVAAAFLVMLVALSRIYLGLHYVSDVIAAMAEGVAWLMLCHMAVTTLWHRRGLSFE